MGMMKAYTYNQKSINYPLLQEKLERARERKDELKQQVSELQEEIEHSKEAHGYIVFVLCVIISAQPFLVATLCDSYLNIPQGEEKHLTKTNALVICRVLNNKWREKSNLIGELEGQVRHMRTTWEDKERKLTQERDRAIDAAR